MANPLPAPVGLTDAERIFVQSRVKGLGLEASARAAGFTNVKTAVVDLQASPAVQHAIDLYQATMAEKTSVTRRTIEDMLLEAFRAAETAAEMIMATKELAKLHGLYAVQKTEVKHTVERAKSEKQLRTLSVEDLERLAAENPTHVVECQEFHEVASG